MDGRKRRADRYAIVPATLEAVGGLALWWGIRVPGRPCKIPVPHPSKPAQFQFSMGSLSGIRAVRWPAQPGRKTLTLDMMKGNEAFESVNLW
ncbi:unnamed protein product [Merluccius merluccius]